MKIVDGIKIGNQILESCKSKVTKMPIQPRLDIIMVGDNSASLTYIEKKRLAGEKVGVNVNIHKFATSTDQELISLVESLNNDQGVHGIIVQLPLPVGLNESKVCQTISPVKDVDGLNPISFGQLWLNDDNTLIPATVNAVEYVLKHIATEEHLDYPNYIEGKSVLIINRSQIIGKPLAGLLLKRNATITLAHSKTKDLNNLISQADIVISGTGKENFIANQEFKKGAVLIDVGFNKTDKRIYGDVDKNIGEQNIEWLTPVPGGVGPIGVACLIENVIFVASH